MTEAEERLPDGWVRDENGEIVEACWREIAGQWPGVRPLGCQLMPDHFHGILFVERPQAKALGNIVGSFKSKSASRVKQRLAARGQGPNGGGQGPNGGGGREAGVSCASSRATGLWSPGFQDTILFHEGQLDNMFRYLADNPRRRAIKALYPELFKVSAEIAVSLAVGRGRFSALGNRFLLERPLAQVQVSRREIARLALNAQLPLVTLHNKGFSKLQKPSGRYFDACADGRLLMLAPAAWPHQPGEKTMTRVDATAMNRLCQWIVGPAAAEINYHGMKPENIDALALAAAKVVLAKRRNPLESTPIPLGKSLKALGINSSKKPLHKHPPHTPVEGPKTEG